MSSTITAGNATNGLAIASDITGTLQIKTGTGAGTTALTIDASQNATFAGTVTGVSALSTASGSAPSYSARAWVNFNGTTATPSTIRGSGNVTSVTKTGTGVYIVNYTIAMQDANYMAAVEQRNNSFTAGTGNQVDKTTTNITINYYGGSAGVTIDRDCCGVAIFR